MRLQHSGRPCVRCLGLRPACALIRAESCSYGQPGTGLRIQVGPGVPKGLLGRAGHHCWTRSTLNPTPDPLLALSPAWARRDGRCATAGRDQLTGFRVEGWGAAHLAAQPGCQARPARLRADAGLDAVRLARLGLHDRPAGRPVGLRPCGTQLVRSVYSTQLHACRSRPPCLPPSWSPPLQQQRGLQQVLGGVPTALADAWGSAPAEWKDGRTDSRSAASCRPGSQHGGWAQAQGSWLLAKLVMRSRLTGTGRSQTSGRAWMPRMAGQRQHVGGRKGVPGPVRVHRLDLQQRLSGHVMQQLRQAGL